MTRPTEWRTATITKIHRETSMVRTFTFEFAQAVQHLAGQHYELRLTAEDGYQATRLYSAANPASTGDGRTLELTIALMPQGEVSPYLFNHVETGAQIELRGPLGRYFVWDANVTGPTLLLGGGTGVVPLRA
ncbi:MAG TPA: FAD-binding oxidoreductase, partial [Candidatus Saccharimonas sp.]|nr:FAD-binding oxidoreductase [Candidatus Saccharimonas sp.]